MRNRAVVAITAAGLAAMLGSGCKKEPAKAGTTMSDVAYDTETLGNASAAVNEVLRLAADCDAARPLIPEAKTKLDQAEHDVRTAGGKATLDGLRAQLANVDRNCP